MHENMWNNTNSGCVSALTRLPRCIAWLLLSAIIVPGFVGTAWSQVSDIPMKNAEGFWEYTGLVTKDGQSMPLTGVFLIKNGVFLQQSIFDLEGTAFAQQSAMAHAGPYWAGGAGLRLRSNQTLSLDPAGTQVLTSAGALEHDLAVTRDDEELTLVFGGGTSTVQTFTRLGDANDAQVFAFEDGALAFADGRFILVIGNELRAVTGYGTFTQADSLLTLNAVRWSASDAQQVINLKDTTIPAFFDEDRLTLPGGQSYAVVP